jgi:hypothetical protein
LRLVDQFLVDRLMEFASNIAASPQRASDDARAAQQKAKEIATTPPPARFPRGEGDDAPSLK